MKKIVWINLTREKQGELSIFFESLLWSLFPVITIMSFSAVSPLLSLAWSTLFAAMFLAIVLYWKNGWGALWDRSAMKDVLSATFILGMAYYFLYFNGLRYTTAGNASIITLTEIFFSFMFFNVWRKEHFSLEHMAGAVLMLVGAFIVLYPDLHVFQLGDFLVLSASFISPMGNFFQRRARKKISSEAILFIRNAISAPAIFAFAYFSGADFASIGIGKPFLFLAINGFFLLGLSKLLWIEGIHRISVTKASALSSLSPLLTLLFAWMLLGDVPTRFQLFAFIPMFSGVLLLSGDRKIWTRKAEKCDVRLLAQ